MSPARLRAYVLIVMRDVLIPGGGLFLAIYLPLSDLFQPWQLPLIAGMLGTPLVGRGEEPEPDTRPDALPPPDEGEG
jgi:hypothetical protein